MPIDRHFDAARIDPRAFRVLNWGDLGPTNEREPPTPDLVRLTTRLGELDTETIEVLGERWQRLIRRDSPRWPVAVWANVIRRWYGSAIANFLAFEPRHRWIDAAALVLERADALDLPLPTRGAVQTVATILARLPNQLPGGQLDEPGETALLGCPPPWSAAMLAATAAMVADVSNDAPEWLNVWIRAALDPEPA